MAFTPNVAPDTSGSTPKPWQIGSLSRRTRRRGLLLSGFVGVAALLMSVFSHAQAKAPVTLAVAKQTLPAGTVLTAADVTLTKMPAPGVSHAVTSLAAVLGHRLNFGVGAGQPLVQTDIASTPLVQGLTSQEVAVMLPVSLASSDNVKPNDRVDVIWVGSGQNGSSSGTGSSAHGTITAPGTVIARGLRVISVLNSSGGPVQAPGSTGINATTPAAVEVAVPSGEAGTLAIAAASGHFWLDRDPWASSTTAQRSTPTLSTPVTPFDASQTQTGSATATGTSSVTGSSSVVTHSAGNAPASVTPSPAAAVAKTSSAPASASHHG